jgi:hypothetical protein
MVIPVPDEQETRPRAFLLLVSLGQHLLRA